MTWASRWQLVALALVTTVTAVVSSLGAPLVPEIADVFELALTDAQWVLTATLLAGAVATPILGRFGSGPLRRPTILTGLVVVTVGSALCTVPLGFGALVAGRAMQGVGLALVPLAIAVARDAMPPEHVSRAVAVLSVSTIAGAGLGYPMTALVAQTGGLAAAYGLGTVLTGLTLVMAWVFVPPSNGERPAGVDWFGAVLLSVSMVALLLGVTRGATWGWTSATTAALAVTGAVVLGWWVRHSLRTSGPLVDLRLALRPGLVGPNLTALMAGVGMYGLLSLVIVLVQDDSGWGLDQSLLVGALMLVPYSVMSVLGASLARVLDARWGPRPLLPTGCLLFFGASATLALEHDAVWEAAVCMAIAGLGSGLTFSSLPVQMLPFLPRSETGSAMAFNQVLRYLGFTIGSSASVTLMALFGGGAAGFRTSLLILSSTSVLAAAVSYAVGRPPRT